MKTSFAIVILACVAAAAGAEAAPTCGGPDHRTLWLQDLYRGDELRVRPFGCHGIPYQRDWRRISRFFRDRHDLRRTVAPGLLRVLAQVQRHFGGRPLHLMSGYRSPGDPQALSSYHQVGHAADIWIDGVENRYLFEYCRALERSGEALGCGLYPRGSHVHVDVRSRATIWVDLSGYGDGANYVPDPAAWLDAHPSAGRRPAPRQPPRPGNRNRSGIGSGSRIGTRSRIGSRGRNGISSRSGIRSGVGRTPAPPRQPRSRPAFLAAPSGSGFRACGATAAPDSTLRCARFCHGARAEGGVTTPNPKESPT